MSCAIRLFFLGGGGTVGHETIKVVKWYIYRMISYQSQGERGSERIVDWSAAVIRRIGFVLFFHVENAVLCRHLQCARGQALSVLEVYDPVM